MRRSPYMIAVAAIILLALLISGTGCAKKPKPEPPTSSSTAESKAPSSTTASPPPTISLAASPSAIEKGKSITLTWNSSNATSVAIDNGVGTVEPSGSRTIRPGVSTTYMAKATGPGGSAVAEARVTVTAPAAITGTPPELPAIGDPAYFDANIKDAFFDYDQYSIREDAQEALMNDARILRERPGIRITVEGYCDERGSEKYNLALGDRRANAVKDFLVSQGISSNRIETTTYGEERSFCEEHNEECWQLNRRGHLVMR